MKKLIFILALLLIATPAWSTMTIDFTPTESYEENWDPCDPNVFIAEGYFSYDVNGGSKARAFALVIELDNEEFEIDGLWRDGPGGDAYWVSPGNASVDGEEIDGGAPGVQNDGISAIVEMASLYASGEPGPPDACDLLFMSVIGPNDTEVCFTVTAEPIRGGVINEAGAELTIDTNDPMCLQTSVPILPDTDPECWGYACFGCGDADGNDEISAADALVLVNAWPPKAYNACADFNQDDEVGPADALILVNHWPPKEACPVGEGCQ